MGHGVVWGRFIERGVCVYCIKKSNKHNGKYLGSEASLPLALCCDLGGELALAMPVEWLGGRSYM